MLRAFFGTFFGKIAAAIVLAVMVALGVGPDWLAQEILSVRPVWYVRVLLIVLAAIGAASTFWPQVSRLFRSCPALPAAPTPVVAPMRDDVPDVRVADEQGVRSMFEGDERDALLPLLAADKLHAWGRLGNGFPPLLAIPGDRWSSHFLEYHPASTAGSTRLS